MIAVTFAPQTVRRVRLWDFIFYMSFGVAITFSVNVAGVLLIFSTLVIPAVIAYMYTTKFMPALLIAWLAGAIAIASGVAVSFVWDITTGPLLVVAFGIVLILAVLLKPLIGRRTPAPLDATDVPGAATGAAHD
jgi:zinc/manganese transport system permease protein